MMQTIWNPVNSHRQVNMGRISVPSMEGSGLGAIKGSPSPGYRFPAIPVNEAGKKRIRVVLGSFVEIATTQLPEAVSEEIVKRLTFDNPRYIREARFGRIRRDTTRHLHCAWKREDNLVLARGFMHELIRLFHANRLQYKIEDKTVRTPWPEVRFKQPMQDFHQGMLEAVENRRFGIIAGPKGSGKIPMALCLVARKQMSTLVIVKTKARLYQWKEAICRHLNVDGESVGLIGDGHARLGAGITVAIDRSLYKNIEAAKSWTGFLILDLCDQANLKIFFKAVGAMESFRMLGIASAAERTDGLDGVMKAFIGPVLCELKGGAESRGPGKALPVLQMRKTGFDFDYRENFAQLMTALSLDRERNGAIVTDILERTADPKARALIVCERVEHLKRLQGLLEASHAKAARVSGKTSLNQLESIQRRYDNGKLQIILTTLKSMHKLDVKKTSHLFIASPQSFGDHLFQALGSLMKQNHEKQNLVIHDYLDHPKVLKTSFRQRLKFYRALGLKAENVVEVESNETQSC